MARALRGALGIAASFLFLVATGRGSLATIPAGTKIVNEASATYQSVTGTSYATKSNVVTVAVATVASLTFGPQDPACSSTSDAVKPKSTFTRTFTITNTSNGQDAYRVSALSVSAGTIQSVAFVSGTNAQPTSIDGSISQPVPPAGSIALSVVISDAGVALGSKMIVSATVRTTMNDANGSISESAQQCGFVQAPPVLSGPGGADDAIQKTVDGVSAVQSTDAATLTYDVTFLNSGGEPAENVVFSDAVPAGIVPIADSATVNGRPVSGDATVNSNAITIPIGPVAIGQTEHVRFTATLSKTAPSGKSLINVATISSSSVPTVSTLPASVFVGSGNVVYDGDVGASAPIAGAIVTVSNVGNSAAAPLSGTPVAVNAGQSNPMTTSTSGRYGFGIAAGKSVAYDVTVSAAGYVPRKLELTLVPDATGTLYNATFTAIDGAPLAVPGGFTLEAGPVTLASVYGFFGNIPMFHAQRLSVTKVVDRASASTGDRLVYTLTVASATTTFGTTKMTDTLPPFVAYAPGTSRVDGVPVEPVASGSVLVWSFPKLTQPHTIVFAAVVLPNATDGTTLTNTVLATAMVPNSSNFFATGRAEAQTVIVPGMFSNRIPITGRVYLDVKGTGRFTRGDVGVGSVRVWLEDGESVTTDPAGRFDFPAARPGMHVLHLDPDTVPAGATCYPTRAYDDERSPVRLVHGPFDGGLLQDVNFALRPLGTPHA